MTAGTLLLLSVSVAVSATLVFVGEEGVVLTIVEAITTGHCENGKLIERLLRNAKRCDSVNGQRVLFIGLEGKGALIDG